MKLWALYAWPRNWFVISDSCKAIITFLTLIFSWEMKHYKPLTKKHVLYVLSAFLYFYQRLTKFIVMLSLFASNFIYQCH